MRSINHILLAAMALVMISITTACRHDDEIFIPEVVPIVKPEFSSIRGFYLLNEGNMGSNKCTLDFFDYTTGAYTRNIYGIANPTVPKELGDVGNDIAIYGSKLYAVINCSNKVEVMHAATAERLGQIDIPNCRYITFRDRYAYVSSYAGPVIITPEYEQKGLVLKVDTASLQIVDQCVVGFQPDMMQIIDDKLYVANSGGYMVPRYENTVSVIDMNSFKVVENIPIAINLHRLAADNHGGLWITSRGDYYDTEARLFCYDVRKRRIVAEFQESVTSMDIVGDSIYFVASSFSYAAGQGTASYGIIDVTKHQKVCENFITDGSDAAIKTPYGVKVNPINGDIFVTDSRDHVTPGYLYCFSPDGKQQWKVRTGDIPAHFAFIE